MQCLGSCQLFFVLAISVHKHRQIFSSELCVIANDIIDYMITVSMI